MNTPKPPKTNSDFFAALFKTAVQSVPEDLGGDMGAFVAHSKKATLEKLEDAEDAPHKEAGDEDAIDVEGETIKD